MVQLILRAVLALSVGAGTQPEHTYYSGFLVYYAKGVFERVERNRGLPHVKCNVASPRHKIGTWVWVEGVETGKRLRCRVSDTSKPEHRAGHIKRKIFEMDYTSAHAICIPGWQGAAKECRIRISQ